MIRNVGVGQKHSVAEMMEDKTLPKIYDSEGYKVVTTQIVSHLQMLIMDADVDVRRSASDSLAGLAFHIRKDDIGTVILPIPLRLSQQQQLQYQQQPQKQDGGNINNQSATKVKKNSQQLQQQHTADDGLTEELRITAANLLAELGGAGENDAIPRSLVSELILPAVLALCRDPGFRVRRAAAQALPRVLGGTTVEDAQTRILPAFELLSKDEIYRVRKSTGECLVDMSRSMMLLVPTNDSSNVNALRRQTLIPIAETLLADANKFVRHGMMQFLGPFLASFYPFVYSALRTILPGTSESDGSNHSGIVAQFFPHASSMVSRLNSSAAATTSAPTPTLSTIDTSQETPLVKELQQTLPLFIHAGRTSSISLKAVVAHRRRDPPDPEDIHAVMGKVLDHFTGLSRANTGDGNTDAEMRVYCAYSYPAVVLLLGPENWEGRLKDCFKTLLNPNYGSEGAASAVAPPLPVKRCLASSLHTVAHILGPEIATNDIMPIFRDHFLNDTDESVRLNMIRNFPTLVSLLEPPIRNQYIMQWCEIIRGEEVLGAMKRSATNPLVLNWRQRDYVSRSLPDLLVMVDAVFAYNHLWPIMKLVLTDTISLVREDAIWAIPMLLKSLAIENILDVDGGTSQKAKEVWSSGACQEVIGWLKETILRISSGTKGKPSYSKAGNFSQRQLYCQVCTAMALALRFGDGLKDPDDPVIELESKFSTTLQTRGSDIKIEEYGPYRKLSTGERKHLLRLLTNDVVPLALEFKDDRVTNVRLSLRKTLLLMPNDVVQLPAFKEALQCLEEEVETWESFDGLEAPPPPPRLTQPVVNKSSMSNADFGQANGDDTSGEDVRDTGMATSNKGSSKRKLSKREKKKGGENLQEHDNGIQSQMMASI
jgi:serine/threonine-protein phosphatase 4 regulatory subunit 1